MANVLPELVAERYVGAIACIPAEGGKQYRPGSLSVSGDEYYRVVEQYISFNPYTTFYYGTGTLPSGSVDFWGLATHELGHSVVLRDIRDCESTIYTMCSGLSTRSLSDDWRTLTSDDVAAANKILPPGDYYP